MRKFTIFAVLLGLIGCSWRSPDSTFYMMRSDGIEQLSNRKVNIAVANVKVPDLLNRSQIVIYEPKSSKVEILEFNRWAEVFPDVLQNAVVNNLMAYFPEAYVQRSYFDKQNADFNINIEVNQLQAYPKDKVVLQVWWNIRNKNGKILARQQQTFEVKVNGKSMQDLVDAEAEAVNMLSQSIAEKIVSMK